MRTSFARLERTAGNDQRRLVCQLKLPPVDSLSVPTSINSDNRRRIYSAQFGVAIHQRLKNSTLIIPDPGCRSLPIRFAWPTRSLHSPDPIDYQTGRGWSMRANSPTRYGETMSPQDALRAAARGPQTAPTDGRRITAAAPRRPHSRHGQRDRLVQDLNLRIPEFPPVPFPAWRTNDGGIRTRRRLLTPPSLDPVARNARRRSLA